MRDVSVGSIKRDDSGSRAFYVQDKVKLFKSNVEKYLEVLKELNKLFDEFSEISSYNNSERNEFFRDRIGYKKRLKISFSSKEELQRILEESKWRLTARSSLGVRSGEDWIYNFNIGNIMHLTPIGFDDLNSHNVNPISELSKDSIFEQIILLTTSLFCNGTEARFLSF